MSHKNKITLGVASFGKSQIEKPKLQNGIQPAGSIIKRALIVFEGTHQGMFGPVVLSKEFLQVMLDRFNREFANPKNENDYPPILKEHDRDADNIFGRLIPEIVMDENWVNPRNGETVAALFSDLRIDDVGAQDKVDQGKYSNLSVSFDDDPNNLGEIFEISFVAVEAARGAQVLQNKQGENTMELKELQKKLDSTQRSLAAQKSKSSAKALVLKATIKSLSLNLKEAQKDAKELGTAIKETAQALRSGVVKSQFKEFVSQGRLSKADFDKIDVKAIAAMPAESQKVVLKAYADRPVSADLVQIGTQGAEPLGKDTVKKLSAQDTRELIKAQREGRKANLSQALFQDDPKKEDDPALTGNPEEDVVELPGMTMDDIEDSLKKLEGLADMQSRLKDAITKMKSTLAGLQGDDDDNDDDNGEE